MSSQEIDYMTILDCDGLAAVAAKKWCVHEDGTIDKHDYNAGYRFTWVQKPVSSLADIQAILEDLQHQPKKFIIRGKPKPDAGEIVLRRSRKEREGAAFDAAPHHWVMVDVDKIEYPAHLDVCEEPQAVIGWMKSQLPDAFQTARCVYKFSSSQNVPDKLGKAPKKTVSAHLYYWCDRPVADAEWKRLFTAHGSKVDLSLFNPVQPHYTANPIFVGMADPLPERMGVC